MTVAAWPGTDKKTPLENRAPRSAPKRHPVVSVCPQDVLFSNSKVWTIDTCYMNLSINNLRYADAHGLWPPSRLLYPWGFSRQECWNGLPCPPPRDLPNPRIKPRSPASQADSLPSEPPGKPIKVVRIYLLECSEKTTSTNWNQKLGHEN